jgi:hypothetical protein
MKSLPKLPCESRKLLIRFLCTVRNTIDSVGYIACTIRKITAFVGNYFSKNISSVFTRTFSKSLTLIGKIFSDEKKIFTRSFLITQNFSFFPHKIGV